MNIQKIEIAISQLEGVHRDMNDCVNRFILKDAIDQLQEQVKNQSIPDLVGQSKQITLHQIWIMAQIYNSYDFVEMIKLIRE